MSKDDGGCPTSTTICPPSNTAFTPTISNPVTSEQQSYGGSDISWPNLLPIHVGSDYNPQTSNDLFLVFTGSYMDGSTYRFSRQGMGPGYVLATQDNAYNVNHSAVLDYTQGSTLAPKTYDVTIKTGNTNLIYKANFPNGSGDNPNVCPGNDMSFKYSGQDLFQFYFSASVPSAVYSNSYLTATPIGPNIDMKECRVGGTFKNCTCGDEVNNNSYVKDFLTIQGQAFTPSTWFQEWPGYNTQTKNVQAQNNPQTPQNGGCGSMAGGYTVVAHMRDGLRRITSQNKTCGGVTYSWQNPQGDTQYWTDSGWTTTLKTSNVNALAFPSNTCSTNYYQHQSAHYLLDSDGTNNRSYFLQIKIHDLPQNIHFSETVQGDEKEDILLKSFNIRGRFPGCLSADVTTPKPTPTFANKATDYIQVGSTLGTNTTDFNWIIPLNLGGNGAQDSKVGQVYKPSDGHIWDSSKGDYKDWPNISAIRNQIPDIVVRIVFYNPVLFDPTAGLDGLPPLSLKSIQNFQSTVLTLFQQNTPEQSIKQCNQLYVKPFERGVAFLEFITTVFYSLIFQFNLDAYATQVELFDVSYNVYMEDGKNYQAVDFLKHIYDRMDGVTINDKAGLPTLLTANGAEDTRDIQSEFDSWVNETMQHTDKYIHYPSFTSATCSQTNAPTCSPPKTTCTNPTSAASPVLYVDIHMHSMMHANMQTKNTKDLDLAMSIYLNNFFQDYTSQIPGGTTYQATQNRLECLETWLFRRVRTCSTVRPDCPSKCHVRTRSTRWT